MRFTLCASFLCLLSAGAVQAGIMTGTACLANATGPIVLSTSTSSSCAVMDAPIWQASASISGSISGPSFGSPSTSAGASFSANAGTIAGTVSFSTAAALGTADLELATSGPVRNGFIDVFEQMSGPSTAEIPPTQQVNIAVGALQTSCKLSFESTACTGNLGPSNGYSPMTVQPFTLGQHFSFSESLEILATSPSASSDNNSSGAPSVDFSFSFLESDGKTPVEIFLVPEPGTLALIITGLVVVCSFRKKGVRPPLG
jgi:hypothetical protein